MINAHLHIWSSVWDDEYKKMIESTNQTNIDIEPTKKPTTIMVDNKPKRGKK